MKKKKIHGKIVGALLGFAFGGPFGAALGIVVGHAHDNRADDDLGFWQTMHQSYADISGNTHQVAFTMGVIVLGAKMAKADGRVTRAEIEAFKRVFRVTPAQTESVGRLFDQAVRSFDGFEPYAFRLAQIFQQPSVLEEVLSGLFIIAAADNKGLSPAELKFLRRVAEIFRFNETDFVRIAARAGISLSQSAGHAEKPRDESYAILGLREQATVEEIKTTYRALIRKHHPDKLVAEGMPPEFIATANEKMKRINGAYDTICRARGIK
jgi:DnaJ like chaperone protein